MKNNLLLFISFYLLQIATAQEDSLTKTKNISLKWAPTGLILGNINFQGEYSFGKQSLTAKIGIPLSAHHAIEYDGNDVMFDMKATTFLAGYRVYISKKQMKGLYFEPYFKYVHHSSEGNGRSKLSGRNASLHFTNQYNGIGVGTQLGNQFFIGKRFIIDFFFLGPEINVASNHFKAVENGSNGMWTKAEAQDAEWDIKNFIDKFPFLKNKTDIKADADNGSVKADFKGVLPGFRIGVSFGIAL